jgi:tetratricopeptide (TPR) repeat protein
MDNINATKLTKTIEFTKKDSSYLSLAQHYYKYFKLTNDETNFEAAIQNITKAIGENPNKLGNYAMRANYYMGAGKRELATPDIDYIKLYFDIKLQFDPHSNIVADLYIKSVIDDSLDDDDDEEEPPGIMKEFTGGDPIPFEDLHIRR